ncbi:MAG: hypothetical protein WDO16_03655 [Bacteroidota bacterium]
MANDTNLQFIREKIGQLRSAVMYAKANGPAKIENDIVTAIEVDDEGQLWFLASNPPCHADEEEQSFPARLRFYRKGLDFFMEVSGKATLVKNDYSFTEPDGSKNMKKMLLKMAMADVEYTEPHTKKPKSRIEILMADWYAKFLHLVAVEHNSESVLKKLRQTN